MELHLGYEQAEPYPLTRIEIKPEPGKVPLTVKTILKADQAAGFIQLDSATTLKGVPPAAWEYRLGSRSAIEWVLEYHKESKPKDPTIRFDRCFAGIVEESSSKTAARTEMRRAGKAFRSDQGRSLVSRLRWE
jgi:predicted helicase